MFHKKFAAVGSRSRLFLVVVLLALTTWFSQQHETAGILLAQEQDSPAAGTVLITEIMPNPADGPEWVELYKPAGDRLFLPLVTHAASGTSLVSAAAESAGAQPLANASLAGWQLGNEEGVWYTLPSDLPPVPPTAYIVVYFDGKGAAANDYDFSDNVAELHTPAGMTGAFGDGEGQAALYSSESHSAETIQSFLAWGNTPPGTAAQNAAEAGIWKTSWAVPAEANAGDIVEASTTGLAFGLIPGGEATQLDGWSAYDEENSTPGAANIAPRPRWLKTENGAVMDVNEFAVGWQVVPGAEEYQFQMATEDSFARPEVDVMTMEPSYVPSSHPMQTRATQPRVGSQIQTPKLDAGIYVWRVRAKVNGLWSPWSLIGNLELVAPFGCTTVTLGMPWKLQHSDTPMLELDGSPETGQFAWDEPDRDGDGNPVRGTPLGNNYCVRASVAMVNDYYGGNLSQDRISYHVLEEWSANTRPNTNDGVPENDLGYGRGMYYHDEEDEAFSWALGLSPTQVAIDGKPTFEQFKTWLDEGRGIMMRNPGHMMAVEGYRVCSDGSEWLHINDPWDAPRWQDYDSQNMFGVWPGPAGVGGAPGARSDEASIWTDTEGDGISTFDEINRFFTSSFDADTDNDLVTDQNDLREYVFDSSGTYSKRNPDFDGDESRKELDPDNDGDGAIDGCEDDNRNGRYEPGLGETNNFSAFSTATCTGPLLYVNWAEMDFDTYIQQRNFQIRNMGSGTLNWSIDTSSFPSWLSVSDTSGSVEPFQGTEDQDTIYVNVDRSDLSPGDYSHTIEITSNDGSAFTTALVTVAPTTPLGPPDYDSDWTPIDIDSALTFSHELGGDRDDYRVVLEYRTDDVNGINLRYYGGADFGANAAPGHQENDRVAAYWRSLTGSSVTVYRRPEDTYALDVRVRIWVMPEPDYDSGWVSMGQDQARHFVHELDGRPQDYLVDVQYQTGGGDVNARYYGGIDFGATAFNGTRNDERMGTYWRSLDDRSIWVYRRPEDIYADQVRVRIWRVAPADYDSDWVAINPDTAQALRHGLGGDANNYYVDMMYNAGSNSFDGVNARYFGGADFGSNTLGGNSENHRVGAYWRSLDSTAITIYRRPEDVYAPFMRIRIWDLSSP